MSRCWCKCESGTQHCGPKVPGLKSLFGGHKQNDNDDPFLKRADMQAELQFIWDELGEEKNPKLDEVRRKIDAAVDKVYDKALAVGMRRRKVKTNQKTNTNPSLCARLNANIPTSPIRALGRSTSDESGPSWAKSKTLQDDDKNKKDDAKESPTLGMAYASPSERSPINARGSSQSRYASRYTRAYSQTPDDPESLFSKLWGSDSVLAGEDKLKKVTVVGIGNVGMACAQTILTDHLTDAIALVATNPDKLRGEMLDLQHAAAFMPTVSITADVDYKITANSDICIITAGARQQEGEDRLSLVDRNVQVFKAIIPKLVKYSPNTIFLVISNPVDILTWVTWKLSGFPPNRVIGTGTNLDSSRFRCLLANQFKISVQNVHAHILGEHGDSSVPIWSSVRVAGVPVTPALLSQGESTDEEVLTKAHQMVVDGAYEVIKLKGYTSWAIGYSAAGLVSSILRNQRRVHPVSIMAQGFHGIKHDVFLSLPAMLGKRGVHAVVNSEFDEDEIKQLQASAAQIWEIQSKISLK